MDKEEKRKKEIITENRMITIRKREVSFEGVSGKMKSGEDGIYSLISNLGKNTLLTFKDPITEEELKRMPELQILKDEIEVVEEQYRRSAGRNKFLLKKQLIEMHRDLYVIRQSYRGKTGERINYNRNNPTSLSLSRYVFEDDYSFDKDGNPVNNGTVSFFNPKHIEALFCNYSALKEASYGNFYNGNLWYLMEDFDDLVIRALKEKYPLYYDLIVYKIDGKSNAEIQELLNNTYGIKYTVEYISSLWRRKIPRVVAEDAQKDYLNWYYSEVEKGHWKTCSRCGETKLAHQKFFSRNRSSGDGWYSLCKDCRNAKSKKNQKLIQLRQKRKESADGSKRN